MEPFNIRILHKDEELTLTILPEKDYFKVVYFGGIVGAMKEVDGAWVLLPEEDIEAGDLPFYDYKMSVDDQPKLELSLPKINQIAAEIENVIH